MRLESYRALLALAASQDWEIHQIDFKNAYLNGELDEMIYMKQPPGFEAPGRSDQVWLLLKAIYGLKQAGKRVQVMFLEQATMGFFLLPNSDLFYLLVERLRAFISATP